MEEMGAVVDRIMNSVAGEAVSQICPECGREIAYESVSLGTRTWRVALACPCRLDSENKRMRQLILAAKQREVDRFFPSDIGPRLEDCTFESWIPRKGTEACLNVALKYAANFDGQLARGSGLVFWGTNGSGKTHLLMAIYNYVKDQGRVCLSRSIPALLKRIQECFDPQPKIREADIYRALAACDLLVLDDLGAEQASDMSGKRTMTPWGQSTLFLIVDERYRYRKPTLFTTNLTPTELKGRVGDRTYSRLREMCEFYQNRGSDFREERAVSR